MSKSLLHHLADAVFSILASCFYQIKPFRQVAQKDPVGPSVRLHPLSQSIVHPHFCWFHPHDEDRAVSGVWAELHAGLLQRLVKTRTVDRVGNVQHLVVGT